MILIIYAFGLYILHGVANKRRSVFVSIYDEKERGEDSERVTKIVSYFLHNP